ncbi:MAG: glycosyltransferase [Anaerolineae bacterium]|nr:glycosyltransferase [Anaerolineae bacterium]
MRILLISRCPPYPLHLGDRLIVYHLAEELEALGHEIDLLAFANRAEDWHEQGRYDHLFGQVRLFTEPRRSQGEYLRRALLPTARWPRRAEQSWSPEMWRAIEAALAATRYDALHLFGGIQVYEFAGALGGRPAVITPYESYSLYLRRALASASGAARLTTRVQLALARHFESWMFTPYKRVVVVSERDRDELLGLNPALPVQVIPNGVDTYHFRPRPTGRIPALLFVGNYEYAPNVDAALRLAREIFPAVRQRVPGVRLWLVGNAPPPELRALASDTIRVTGRVPDVRPYLARAGAFVSPLRLGAGIKNKVLEALAMGCPLVATPLSVDGIHVTDGHDALIADGDGLAEAVVRLLSDAALRSQLALNGRALIEREYAWEQVAAAYVGVYQSG